MLEGRCGSLSSCLPAIRCAGAGPAESALLLVLNLCPLVFLDGVCAADIKQVRWSFPTKICMEHLGLSVCCSTGHSRGLLLLEKAGLNYLLRAGLRLSIANLLTTLCLPTAR